MQCQVATDGGALMLGRGTWPAWGPGASPCSGQGIRRRSPLKLKAFEHVGVKMGRQSIFRAKAKFFGQKPTAKNEKKIFFGIY